MWPVAVLSVLLIAVDCAEPCHTWLYPSGDGQCLCGSSLGTVVVCNNETQEVGVLAAYCLTSNGDTNSTSVVGRSLVVTNHGDRLLSWVDIYNRSLLKISRLVAISTAKDDCVASVNLTTTCLPILMI